MTPNDAPGSVAEEAALLVDLLSQRGWGAPSRMPSSRRHDDAHPADADGGASDDADGHSNGHSNGHSDGHSDGRAHEHPSGDRAGSPGDTNGESGSRSECTCGGSTPAACRVCPVCQLIAFVQQVNPDTIDRVADFVGFAATALRDLATAQRERTSAPADASTDQTRPGDHR